ncbi:MAG TPA: hypothetical protein VF503_32550 [Sphingobium sp.]|uniref:hypothetical protein n=1 Tax=Sphingobium sp. TaxID=1912891 RepID=UPI002ED3FB63
MMTGTCRRFAHNIALFIGMGWALAFIPLSAQAQPTNTTVRCAGGRSFVIELSSEAASVQIDGQVLHLRRQASTSMTRYSSSDAALIIDGDYVAFVMTDALDFTECHLPRTASDNASAMARPGPIPR